MWVIFDLNGTLVDPGVLLEPAELGVTALDEANMMAMVTVLAGRETDVQAAARRGAAARSRARRPRSGAGRGRARAAAVDARLPGRPGGAGAAARGRLPARRADAVLGWRPPRRCWRTSGLRAHFELVLSAPASGAFKPEDLAYRYALDQAGATDAWFVAGHWWDIAGAAFAGLRTAWISRTDLAYPIAMPEPDLRGPDLTTIATRS